MNNDTRDERTPEYTQPTIADFGDLAELTAQGRTGSRADGTFTIGQTVGFISS